MRGDLVYEKLGEIDPELIADALPDAVPLYRLGGENPLPPKKRPNLRKALVVCACLLLAGLLLVGGGVVMSRSGLLGSIAPNTEPVTEPETDDPNARYKGTVTITVGKTGQTVVLADDPALETLGMGIKKLLNRIADGEPSPETYTMGEYVLNVDGIEIWMSVDQSRYMFMKDRQEMLEWVLDDQIAGELEALLRQSLGLENNAPSSPYTGEFLIFDSQGLLIYAGTDPDHADEIEEILAILSRAAEPTKGTIETVANFMISIGDDLLTIRQGTVHDKNRGGTFDIAKEDVDRFKELIEKIVGYYPTWPQESPVIMDYTHTTLHPLDAYTCTVSLVKNEDFFNVYEIKEIYLRATAEGSDYRTDSFREIHDRDSFYCGTIPEDAPLGDYELVVYLFTPYTGMYTELTLTSPTPAVTVAAHEKEPHYAFFYECEKNIYRKGETVSLTAGLINRGDDIYRWSTELSILPTVTLRTVLDGETLTYTMSTGLELDWSGELYHMTYNESSKAEFWTVTPDSLPVGMYDLVLSFEGHEEVFENVLAVTERDIDHEFEINYSIKESPILTEGKALTLQISVTLRGGDLYRYGSSTCFLPDKLFFACETEDAFGYISPKLTHLQADADGNGIGPIVEDGLFTRLWREGETKIFTYAVESDPNSREDILIAGEYDLTVGYDGETPIVFENALAVTDPDAPHGFAVDYSFTPKEGTVDDSVHTVTNNSTGTFILRITHDGDTLYRYGYDDCLRPDSVKLYRQEGESVGESATIFYTTHTEKTKALWAWENDVTQSFLYEWDWSREPIEPGSYTLQVIYRDGDGGIQLHLTLEGALTVVAP